MVLPYKILIDACAIICGYHLGKTTQASYDVEIVIREQKMSKALREENIKMDNEIRSLKCNRIDGNELITWIEDFSHNAEYVSQPTSGDIIRKIEQMMKENK